MAADRHRVHTTRIPGKHSISMWCSLESSAKLLNDTFRKIRSVTNACGIYQSPEVRCKTVDCRLMEQFGSHVVWRSRCELRVETQYSTGLGVRVNGTLSHSRLTPYRCTGVCVFRRNPSSESEVCELFGIERVCGRQPNARTQSIIARTYL